MNIVVSVIDNFGDIGFACELMRTIEREYDDRYIFHLWSEDHPTVDVFLEKNIHILPEITRRDISEFSLHSGTITLLLFHHVLPASRRISGERELFIRIDYLSFDPLWTRHHGSLHIASDQSRVIRECIPSPLPGGGGLIFPERESSWSRESLGDTYGIDPSKRWVSIFSYPDSRDHITIDTLPEDTLILDFSGMMKHEKVHSFPLLSLDTFEACIRESIWAIVRGEVSLISTILLGTPLLWNLYHEIGGYPYEQARDFLSWIDRDEQYEDIFQRLNGQKEGALLFSEIEAYFGSHEWKVPKVEKNLAREIQKYIDSFDFSL